MTVLAALLIIFGANPEHNMFFGAAVALVFLDVILIFFRTLRSI